jgi:hypothetical protein
MGYRVVADRIAPYQELVFDLLPASEIVRFFAGLSTAI